MHGTTAEADLRATAEADPRATAEADPRATAEAAAGDPPPAPLLDDVIDDLLGLLRPLRREPPPGASREATDGWPAADLTLGQLGLLFHLRRGGEQSMSAIADHARCSPQSATALIERLERRGLVAREHRADDRRVVDVGITDSGLAIVQRVEGSRVESLRQALAVLSPAELADLQRLVRAVRERRP